MTLMPVSKISTLALCSAKPGACLLYTSFFLPGLVLDAFEQQSGEALCAWANEILDSGMSTVSMLGCHDGSPLLDLKGLLPEERIQGLIDTLVKPVSYTHLDATAPAV